MTDASDQPPDYPPPADQRPVRGRVLDALIDEGFRPDIDSDGDVAFKIQGQQLFARCTEGEFGLLQVFGQWQIAEQLGADRLRQLEVCNDLSLRINVIKLGVNDGTLIVSGEHVVEAATDVARLVPLTAQLILEAVRMWHEAVAAGGAGELHP